MSANSKIEWTDATVNWWWGCREVSEACRYCYARTMDRMRGPLFDHGRVHWGPNAPRWVRTDSATEEARALDRKAARAGQRLKVFVNSMADTFEDHAQLPPARSILFAEIEQLTNLDFQLLTKRPENIAKMVPSHWLANWPAHVWIGTTVENQECADKRIPELLKIPAKVRFLSCEPLLGAVDLHFTNGLVHGEDAADYCVDWVICGGESGLNARPMHPDWARSLRDRCLEASVPFFFKQWGEFRPCAPGEFRNHISIYPSGLACNYYDSFAACMARVGKARAGRLLDGCQWDEFPHFELVW
jgi:protein gp37